MNEQPLHCTYSPADEPTAEGLSAADVERLRQAGAAMGKLYDEFTLAVLTDPVLAAALQPTFAKQESCYTGLMRACVALSKAKTEAVQQFADHVLRSPKRGQFGF